MIRRLRIVAPAAATVAMASAALAETDGERIAKILTPAVHPCWSIIAPPDGQTPKAFSVSFKLNPDGSLNGNPVALGEAATDYDRQLRKGGVRAVIRCSPYNAVAASGLPHAAWKDIVINFDPSQTTF